jgi:hypothetical protein
LKIINIFIVFAAIAVISMVILIGGWIWDRQHAKQRLKKE